VSQPGKNGAAREAPRLTDPPCRELAVERQLLDLRRLDAEQLGHLRERQHVGLVGAERVVAEDKTTVVMRLDRHTATLVVNRARQQI
jgi:hypothetical protein